MQKRLSILALSNDVFGFIGHNLLLLTVLTFFSFAGSYLFNVLAAYHHKFAVLPYAIYIYLYYYAFIALYYNQKPLFSKEKFWESLKMFCKILLFSLCVLLVAHIGFYILRSLARSFIIFPSIYGFLQRTYHFVLSSPYTRIGVFLGSLFLLSFSFLIPCFSWVSTINGKDNSLLAAYENLRGNYLKVVLIFMFLFGFLSLLISSLGLFLGRGGLSALCALLTVFQIVCYLKLYDQFNE